jgi:hypothetical protein
MCASQTRGVKKKTPRVLVWPITRGVFAKLLSAAYACSTTLLALGPLRAKLSSSPMGRIFSIVKTVVESRWPSQGGTARRRGRASLDSVTGGGRRLFIP